MRPGRLRAGEWVLLGLAVVLALDLFLPDWFAGPSSEGSQSRSGLESGAFAWFCLAVVVLCLTAVLQTAMRRAATGGMASLVALSFLCPVAFLVGLLLIPSGVDGYREGTVLDPVRGSWAALVLLVAIFATTVWAMRDESRGLRPDPGATVLEMPPVAGRSDAVDG